ncbi:Adaptive-response sensory-kinase SasA [Rosistilla carotiformis]|uniref:histidine kinase n=1 Tax=Rosistilla carotiformis TaxID=2528017 RepID=A0A518JWC3_9BACT|nr:HAMP domain-containing sensor histidine kinase [Rosistilla carotiformis]QDV69834.1 Adaptive-response sensory-kinase SasA [Rosistilla carotiformis]
MPQLSMFQAGLTGHLAKPNDEQRVALDFAGHLLTDTAHDLRSPLAAARELTQLVADGIEGPISAEQKQHLQAVVARCNDMQRLIDDMLHFECVRTGSPRIARDWIAACELPAQVQPLIESTRRGRGIGLKWIGFERHLPAMFADADKVKRLLVNLIDNALRATPESGQVTVRTELARSGDRMRLSVEDTGAGIAPQQWSQLSQRGVSQLDGHGLGLSICRQIAALHFTQLDVVSAHGQGARFSLELPTGGASAVVDSFSRWRESIQTTNAATSPIPQPAGQRIRPTRRSTPNVSPVQTLPIETPPPRYPHSVAMVGVSAVQAMPTEPTRNLDRFLQSHCEMHELFYQRNASQWILLLDSNIGEAEQRIVAMDQARSRTGDTLRGTCPLQWSNPLSIAVGTPTDRKQLQQAFVQGKLGPHRPLPPPKSIAETKPVASSTEPLLSAIAQQRLDSEVRWLTQRFRHRQNRLLRQAEAIRPVH